MIRSPPNPECRNEPFTNSNKHHKQQQSHHYDDGSSSSSDDDAHGDDDDDDDDDDENFDDVSGQEIHSRFPILFPLPRPKS